MTKTTPGYVSVSRTKENPATTPITLAAKTWTRLDTGMIDMSDKQVLNHGQVYYEDIPSGIWKFSIRTARGNGNPTAQDDFLVKGPVWAKAYMELGFIKHDSTDDGLRGLEVWAEVACTVQTRIHKAVRPLASDGSVS